MSLLPYVHVDSPLHDAVEGCRVVLSDSELHHLRTVLRLRPGAPVEVADGAGAGAPGLFDGFGVRLAADAVVQAPHRPAMVLAQAVPKGRRFDEVLRVATELGVDAVIPVAAERCIGSPGAQRAARVTGRWEQIVRSACEQSRRPDRPHVGQARSVVELLDASVTSGERTLVLVAEPGAEPLPVVVAGLVADVTTVVVAIGPEGGWSAREREMFAEAGSAPVGLGGPVLRTEHAGAAALAVLAALLGRW